MKVLLKTVFSCIFNNTYYVFYDQNCCAIFSFVVRYDSIALTVSLDKDKYLTPAPNLGRTRASHELELMFMKHYAPNRCLYIKVAKLRTGVGSAEMSHLQNCSLKIYLKRALGGGVGLGGGQDGCERRIELKFL